MPATLHIIVSCTDGKRLRPPESLCLRRYHQGTIEHRFERWWAALSRHSEDGLPAEDLYLGDHWTVCRDIPAVARTGGWSPRLWVISAGYGLIPADAKLSSYAATFQSGHEDSVSRAGRGDRRADQQLWWELLAARPGPKPGESRSISQLVAENPRATVLVAASRHYLMSIERDVIDAQRAIRRGGHLLIVSTSASAPHEDLATSWIATDARLQTRLGGSRLSLHARTARWIVETCGQHGFEPIKVQKMVQRRLDRAAPVTTYDRIRMDDAEVREFIQARIVERGRKASHTALLRELRGSGYACEQSRFRQLFLAMKESLS